MPEMPQKIMAEKEAVKGVIAPTRVSFQNNAKHPMAEKVIGCFICIKRVCLSFHEVPRCFKIS